MNPQEQPFDQADFDALFRDSRGPEGDESQLYGPYSDSLYPPYTMSTDVLSMPPWQPTFAPPPLLNTQIDSQIPDEMSPNSAFSINSLGDRGEIWDNPSTATTRTKRARKKSTAEPPESSTASRARASKRKSSTGTASTTAEDEDKGRQALLERNRVAASKCRERKKVANAELEEKSRVMGAENAYLKATEAALRHELLELKYKCLEHTNCDCDQIRDFMKRQALHQSPTNAVSSYSAEEALLQASETPSSNITTDATETESTPNSSNLYSPPTVDNNRSKSGQHLERRTSSHHP